MRTPNLSIATPPPIPADAPRRSGPRPETAPSLATRRIAAREAQRQQGFRKAHYVSRAELRARRAAGE